jgi:hypothetical protein
MAVNRCFEPLTIQEDILLKNIELGYRLIHLLGYMLMTKLALEVKGTRVSPGSKGGAQSGESSRIKSGLGCDIPFELILRRERGGSFYFFNLVLQR